MAEVGCGDAWAVLADAMMAQRLGSGLKWALSSDASIELVDDGAHARGIRSPSGCHTGPRED